MPLCLLIVVVSISSQLVPASIYCNYFSFVARVLLIICLNEKCIELNNKVIDGHVCQSVYCTSFLPHFLMLRKSKCYHGITSFYLL